MTTASPPNRPVFKFSGIRVSQQPDDVSCGPTCLQGIYDFYGLHLPLATVMSSVRRLDHGGTLAVLLGLDALQRGFDATLFTYNLDVFDPTWFSEWHNDLRPKLERRLKFKRDDVRLASAIEAYLEFLEHGGDVRHRELTPSLIAKIVRRGYPPITGLSATYLYPCERELFDGPKSVFDDVRGDPVGHFVVVSGVDGNTGKFRISDPSADNPAHRSGTYWVSPHRLIGAIFLGVTTYDGNLLIVRPKEA